MSRFLPSWLRLRILVAIPFAALLGVVIGTAVARQYGGGAASYAVLITLGGLAVVWLGGALERAAIALLAGAPELAHRVVPPAVDATLGGAVAAGLAVWLDTNVVAAIGAGSAFFALYTAIVRKILLGEAVEALFAWIGGGRGTPPPPQYSLADSLAARGLVDAALAELERAAAADPDTPEPILRGARILGRAGRHEDAIAWLRRARNRMPAGGPADAMATREIVEATRYGLGRPAAAAPELARMAERHRGTPAGDWASRELREVRELIRESAGG